MLNPNIVSRLRDAVRSNPNVSEFEGYHIARCPVAVGMMGSVTCIGSEPIWRGRMRPPEAIFGEPVDSSMLHGIGDYEILVPEKKIFLARRASIIGNSAVLVGDGSLLSPDFFGSNDNIKKTLSANLSNRQGYILEESKEGEFIAYYVSRKNQNNIPMRVLFFHNIEPGNYGSFLFRQLPQMFLFQKFDIKFDAYVVPDRTAWWREALSLAHMPERPVYTVSEVCGDIFDEVVCVNGFDAEGFMSASTMAQIREVAIQNYGYAATPDRLRHLAGRLSASDAHDEGRKIYVSRDLSSISRPHYRPLINENEIKDCFVSRGFEIVCPETLTLRAQIDLFRSARCVAGPSGSGMLNSLFCTPKSRILDIEHFHVTVRQHAKVYASADQDYAFLFGLPDPEDHRANLVRRWHVPVERVMPAIDWLLGRTA